MFENVTFKTDASGEQKRKALIKHKAWELALWLVHSCVSASKSDNVIVSLDRKRRRYMASELEENGKVQILLTTDSAAHW